MMTFKKRFIFLSAFLTFSSAAFAEDILKTYEVNVEDAKTKIDLTDLKKDKKNDYKLKFTFKEKENGHGDMYFLSVPFVNSMNKGWERRDSSCFTLWEYVPVKTCTLELEYDPEEARSSESPMVLKYSYQSHDEKDAVQNKIIIGY